MSSLPTGFSFSGVTCGIKPSGKPDVALVALHRPGVAAAVYTQNQIVAAPVVVSRRATPGPVRGLVINSGNANACTGEQGLRDAEWMIERVAAGLSCSPGEVLVMSTGVIGVPLPMEQVAAGISAAVPALQSTPPGFEAAAAAMLTTDQGPKTAFRRFTLEGGATVRIAAMAKGAGMIAPNMATMLAVVTTDMPLGAEQAQRMLRAAADRSFNCISVEGHTSTNDTLTLLSSGAATGEASDADRSRFQHELTELCIELAKQIPADGEGAQHLIEIHVRGASDETAAKRIADTVANSPLVKTAVTGNDPNWGRIVSAAGYAGVPLDLAVLSLAIQGIPVYQRGAPVAFDAEAVSRQMASRDPVVLELTVGRGAGRCVCWTSDLTVEYVRFNSDYTT